MPKHLQKGTLALMFVCAFSVNGFADDPATKASLESRYIMETDIDQQDGHLTLAESKFSFEHEFKLDNGLPISISLRDRHTDIDAEIPAVFLPSTLEGRSLGVGVKFPAPFTQSENYFVGLDVFPSMYTDGWSRNTASAFRIPGRAYLIYKRDENFIVIAGVSVRPGFDTNVLPIVGFIYRPNERLEFNFASDNPRVTYRFTEKTKLVAEGDIVNDEYELTRDPNKGRVLLYRSLSAGAGLEHEFTSSVSGLVSVGSVFSRSIKYADDVGKIAPEAGIYVKARINISF